jgi:hypothetical protein
MLPRTSLAVLALCVGCTDDSDLLKNGPTVGRACPLSGAAMLSEVPQGSAAAYVSAYADLHGDRTSITLLPAGNKTVTSCKLDWTGTGPENALKISLDAQELGTFDASNAEVWGPADRSVSGSVTLDGYDDSVGSLCGSVDAMMESGGRVRGTFIADVFCE